MAYTAVAADSPLYDTAGRPVATMFSFTYRRSDGRNSDDRPVVFAWDGGPGSSSLWLHVGFLGPWRVAIPDPVHPGVLPPFQVVPNAESLLDIADIVIIDPVGTGFSRMLPGSVPSDFYGVDSDAGTIVQFIQRWLTEYHRWNSPKFILGESYGATRAAVVAKALMGGPTSPTEQLTGISLNGVIVLGPELTQSDKRTAQEQAMDLPTMAATAWYHRKVNTKLGLPDFVSQSENFANGPYVDALRNRERLSEAQMSQIAGHMSNLVGIPATRIIHGKLRFSKTEYLRTLLRNGQTVMGMYDTRLTLPRMPAGDPNDPVADDAAMGQFTPAYVAAFIKYMHSNLRISMRRRYDAINFAVNFQWAYKRRGRLQTTPLQDLSAAMRTNQELRLFVGRGYYDMAIPLGQTDYLLNSVNLPGNRVTKKTYLSGHMIYLGQRQAGELSTDLRRFIESAIPPQ